jgi:CheY-like chemotaxis protein/DNA-directed RNA polymerase specialized sigma24 family protein
MASISDEIVRSIPYLRRYARALTGAQERGDQYVRLCLETIIAEPGKIRPTGDFHLQLFTVFHDCFRIFDQALGEDVPDGALKDAFGKQLAALPSLERQVLLLISLENFSVAEAGRILGLSDAEVVENLALAHEELKRQASAKVLIIEDEPVIAMDIAGIVEGLGHDVIGVAGRKDEAVDLARRHLPDLVLADVQLLDGDSGIVTVQEILKSMTAPVIFVTGFPERLLTGDGVEPAFIVTKPFDPETLRITIGQALSFAQPAEVLAE